MLLNKIKNLDKIYYAGDFDPEGLQIADKLKDLYKDKVEFMLYDEKYYEKIISDKSIIVFPCLRNLLPFRHIIQIIITSGKHHSHHNKKQTAYLYHLFFHIIHSLKIQIQSPYIIRFHFTA